MIPQPWRCTEREKTPAPSAVCTHPTPGSTTTTEPGGLQHPHQLHTGCRNLGETLRELGLDAQFEVECHPVEHKGNLNHLLRGGHAHRHLQQTKPTLAVCGLEGMESFGTGTHHSRWSCQMFCPC